jgi:RNA polymerase sigma-70 factor (ECF subfamily)
MSPPAPRRPATDDRAARDARLDAMIVAAAAGDERAFEQFYDATAGYALALARRMLRGPDIEDLLADAYFEAWRTAARFDAARASAVTWLLTIVRSRALDALRRLSAQPPAGREPGEAGDADDLADDAAVDPADRLWRAEAGSRLDALLRQLAPAERWVLGLAYFRDLSHAQIAAETGLPLGTVKSHLARAQAKLRAGFGQPAAQTGGALR